MPKLIRRTRKRSFDLFSSYTYYTPDIGGLFMLTLMLIIGACLGNLLVFILALFMTPVSAQIYGMLVSYPVMFIPAMLYASARSHRNGMFETGYAIDSNNFGRIGGLKMGLMVSVVTIAGSILADPVNTLLPPMPESLEKVFETLLSDSPLWVTLVSVSVFAPIFEEWLCRGMVMRGLLRKMHPAWAIAISALFFALIHLNPWQAIPAFIFGVLFGYVYYMTGSLKLTMLMHCVNNTMAALLGQSAKMKDIDSLSQILEQWQYIGLLAASLVIIVIFIDIVRKNIPLADEKGNIDKIGSEGGEF